MAHVTVSPAPPQGLLGIAERRWNALAEARPDLAPAVALQRELLGIVIELATTLDSRPLPRLSLPPKYIAAKLTRGVPAFSGEPIPLPVPVLGPAVLSLCDALAAGGAADAATHIKDAVSSGNIEVGSLLTASFKRDQTAIRSGATHRGLAPDLVWLVAELAVSPFIHAIALALSERSPFNLRVTS